MQMMPEPPSTHMFERILLCAVPVAVTKHMQPYLLPGSCGVPKLRVSAPHRGAENDWVSLCLGPESQQGVGVGGRQGAGGSHGLGLVVVAVLSKVVNTCCHTAMHHHAIILKDITICWA